MKRLKERLLEIATLMILIMAIPIIPGIKVQATSSLAQIKATYPDASSWGASQSYDSAQGCLAFAAKCFNLYYGTSFRNGSQTTDKSKIKPGDVVWYSDNETAGHNIWIIGRNGSTITVGEGNAYCIHTKKSQRVCWGRTLNLNNMNVKRVYQAPYTLSSDSSGTSAASLTVTTKAATNITETNAQVNGSVSKSAGTTVTSCGIYLGTSANDMEKKNTESVPASSNNHNNGTGFDIWYNLTSELNITLSPGKTYYYQVYCVAGGKEYKGSTVSFTTKGSSVIKMTSLNVPSTDVTVYSGETLDVKWSTVPSNATEEVVLADRSLNHIHVKLNQNTKTATIEGHLPTTESQKAYFILKGKDSGVTKTVNVTVKDHTPPEIRTPHIESQDENGFKVMFEPYDNCGYHRIGVKIWNDSEPEPAAIRWRDSDSEDTRGTFDASGLWRYYTATWEEYGNLPGLYNVVIFVDDNAENVTESYLYMTHAPSRVSGLKLEGTYEQAELSWDAVPGVTDYTIYRKNTGGSWEKLADVSGTNFSDKTVQPGKDYSYAVEAYLTVTLDEGQYEEPVELRSGYDEIGEAITIPERETDPGTSDPGTSDPGTSDPGTSDPGTSDPGTSDPGTSDPGTSDPGTSDPGTSDPGTSDPGTSDPGTSDPGTSDPGTSDPGTSDPGTGDPGTSDPGTSDPGTSDPGTGDPGTSDPGTGDPGTSDPGTTTPETGGATQTPTTALPSPKPNYTVGSIVNTVYGTYRITSQGSSREVSCETNPSPTSGNVFIPNDIEVNGVAYQVTSVAPNAFKNSKKLKYIQLGSAIRTIGNNAFAGCANLKTVAGGSSLTVIGSNAFAKCKKLTKITLGKNVVKIGKKAFFGCKSLKRIVIKTTKLKKGSIGARAFAGTSAKATVKVPKKSLKSYQKILRAKGVSKKAKITK